MGPNLVAGALVLFAFIAGSIPNGYLIARARGVDIRTMGSGNIGATNVWRTLGKRAGLLCFFLDFLKGLVPSVVAGLVINGRIETALHGAYSETGAMALWLGVALAAVLGHMFTSWLVFRGGEGVACGFGAVMWFFPVFTMGAVVAIVVWAVAVKMTRMVGISSVIAAMALAGVVVLSHFARGGAADVLAAIPGYRAATGIEAGFAAGLCVLIVFKHRGNIARTFAGTERKIGNSSPPR